MSINISTLTSSTLLKYIYILCLETYQPSNTKTGPREMGEGLIVPGSARCCASCCVECLSIIHHWGVAGCIFRSRIFGEKKEAMVGRSCKGTPPSILLLLFFPLSFFFSRSLSFLLCQRRYPISGICGGRGGGVEEKEKIKTKKEK